jgi:hypothetical protein
MKPGKSLSLIGVLTLAFGLVGLTLETARANVPIDAHHEQDKALDPGSIPADQSQPDIPDLLQDEWDKTINGAIWTPGFTATVETSDTVEVVDVIRIDPNDLFTLTEDWNPAELDLITWTIEPPGSTTVITGVGQLIVEGQLDHPDVVTVTKYFHVEPCNWPNTTLEETLVGPGVLDPIRPVIFEKAPHALWITGEYEPEVDAGTPVTFTLNYGNDGGYENDVMVRNEFPAGAPFENAVPPPDRIGPGNLWVEWDVGDLSGGGSSSIDVTVAISSSLAPSTTLEVWDYIYDHTDEIADAVLISFHVRQPPPTGEWDKWINGIPWSPGITLTVETSDTVQVVDVIRVDPLDVFLLHELWNPDELALITYDIDPPGATNVITTPGQITLEGLVGHPAVITVTKWFHVEPSIWEVTYLEEIMETPPVPDPYRAVFFEKLPPLLWIDSQYEPEVAAGDTATFTLTYGNFGGYENDVSIQNEFSQGALFLAADPPPNLQEPDGSVAIWGVGDLPGGGSGEITVTVAVAASLSPSTTIVITDGIYNHLEMLMEETFINLHVEEPPFEDTDIFIKDNPLDNGAVPTNEPYWISPDIWVRTDGDCAQTAHQNPLAGAANTVCIRVRNRSAVTAQAIKVDVYYGSAALSFHWPGGWTPVGSLSIPSLNPGDTAVVPLVWNTPNITGHFCLLVRADALNDPIGWGIDTMAPAEDVPNNNNISMLNLNIIAFPEITDCGYFTTTTAADILELDVVNTTNFTSSVDVVIIGEGFPLEMGGFELEPGNLEGRWSTLTNFDHSGNTLIPIDFPARIGGVQMSPFETVQVTVAITTEIDVAFTIEIRENINDEPVGGINYVRVLPACVYLPLIERPEALTPVSQLEQALLADLD